MVDPANLRIIDDENMDGAENLSFKDIIMSRFKKVLEEMSKEETEGGYQKRIMDGMVYEVIVEDQREIVINCIKALFLPLEPDIETKKDKIKPYLDSYHELKKKEKEYKEEKNKKISEKFQNINNLTPAQQEQRNGDIKTRDVNCEMISLDAHKQLFRGICKLLKLMNYYEEGTA